MPSSLDAEKLLEFIETPPRSGLMREARGLFELPRLLLRFPALARMPRGQGAPVLVLPGFGAGDSSTILLRAYLRLLGYRVRGLGRSKSAEVPELLVTRTNLWMRRQRWTSPKPWHGLVDGGVKFGRCARYLPKDLKSDRSSIESWERSA